MIPGAKAADRRRKEDDVLLDALRALMPHQRVRFIPSERIANEVQIYVMRDTHNPEARAVSVHYFANGAWHETQEGTQFAAIEPWHRNLRYFDE